MSAIKLENLMDLCRICLGKSENMHQIEAIDPNVIDLLTFSADFKVRNTFTTLSNLCGRCKEKLDNFADLTRIAKETQINLENWCKTENTVDEDPDEFPSELNPNDTERAVEKQTPPRKITTFTYDDIMLSIKDAESVSYDSLKCLCCEFVGINIKALISHVAVVHRDLKGRWCPICNDLFDDLRQHKQTHDTSDLTCRFCLKTFTINKYLVQHLLSHTNTPKVKIKELESKNVKTPKIHLREEGNPKLCNVCGKQFSNSSKLLMHLRSHSNDALFSCTICNKKLKTRSHLRQHENLHRDFRPYLCNFCDKSFNQSSTLKTHLKLHGEKTERCSLCDKTFCRVSDLRIHLRTHTGEKPFRCKICNSSFIQKSHLTEHEKKHLDVKPYKCLYCEKSFTQKSTLKSHIDIHLGVKSFQCNFCPYAARQSYVLRTHMKQHEREFVNTQDI